jgi:alpha-glucosidase
MRSLGDNRRAVLVNYIPEQVSVEMPGDWVVEVASDGGGERAPYTGTVGPDQALVLVPMS